jgi:hypothetical protein
VPDLVLVFLPHCHGQFEDVFMVWGSYKDIRWDDCA